jgi:IPT/TIG domain
VPDEPAAALVVRSASPDSGTIGDEVTITGSGFDRVTGLSFGSAASRFTVRSVSEITATVPAAASTGPVKVTGAAVTAASPGSFTVTPGIVLSAASGPAGSTVTVAGAGFGAHEAVDIYAGAAEAALASASGTGNFAGAAVQVPASAVPGRACPLTAVGRHSGLSAQAQFSVIETVTVPDPGQSSTVGTAACLPIRASDSASGRGRPGPGA